MKTNKDRLSSLQSELENLRKEKLHGSFIRSRANWVDSGEKVTKYFCNLEKQNIASKTIPFMRQKMAITYLTKGKSLKKQNIMMKLYIMNQII